MATKKSSKATTAALASALASTINMKDAEKLRAIAEKVRAHVYRGIAEFIAQGACLLEARKIFDKTNGDAGWGNWLKHDCEGMTMRYAARLMTVAKKYRIAKGGIVSSSGVKLPLGTPFAVLRELAAPGADEDAVEALEHRIADNEPVSSRDAAAVIGQAKATAKAAASRDELIKEIDALTPDKDGWRTTAAAADPESETTTGEGAYNKVNMTEAEYAVLYMSDAAPAPAAEPRAETSVGKGLGTAKAQAHRPSTASVTHVQEMSQMAERVARATDQDLDVFVRTLRERGVLNRLAKRIEAAKASSKGKAKA